MTEEVVVLGSGYAGTGAVKRLEAEANEDIDITWISDVDHHLVLHESHRCIRDPNVKDKIVFSCEALTEPTTRFINARVVDLDCDDQTIHLDDGSTVQYNYVLVAFGCSTAFFGIDGLQKHAHTLKSLDDAIGLHDAITDAGREASRESPAQVVVGGAGLSGIQAAGEIAKLRDDLRASIEVYLVEGLDNIFPNNDPVVQAKLRKLLQEKGINIMAGEFITKVDNETVYIGDETELGYDVLVWTGGITGRECASEIEVDKNERNQRITAESTFQTSDERVFAIGDAAIVDQPNQDRPAPPTAQAAWQAADVAGGNIIRTIRGQPLETWRYKDKGTVISVGDKAVAHDVLGVNLVSETFSGLIAEWLKKAIAAGWMLKIAGPLPAVRAWPEM